MGPDAEKAGPGRDDLLGAMRTFQGGDEDSFEPVYRLLWGSVRRRAARMGLPHAEASEIAQKVLVRVYLHARKAEFGSVEQLWGWVKVITVREVYKHWRSRRPDLVPGDLPAEWVAEPADPAPQPPQAAAAGELRQAVGECIARLDEAERMAVVAVLVNELTFRQAAKLAGLTLGKFKHRYEKGLRNLRACLQVKGHDPHDQSRTARGKQDWTQ